MTPKVKGNTNVDVIVEYSPFTVVAAKVMSKKSHTFKKALLQLQFVYQKKQEFKMNHLTVHGLPDGVEKEVYEVIIGGCLDMEEDEDFVLQITGSFAVITFTESFPHEGMCI